MAQQTAHARQASESRPMQAASDPPRPQALIRTLPSPTEDTGKLIFCTAAPSCLLLSAGLRPLPSSQGSAHMQQWHTKLQLRSRISSSAHAWVDLHCQQRSCSKAVQYVRVDFALERGVEVQAQHIDIDVLTQGRIPRRALRPCTCRHLQGCSEPKFPICHAGHAQPEQNAYYKLQKTSRSPCVAHIWGA